MRGNKYHAVPTVLDGVRFASKAEAKRYAELKLLEKAGEIRSLILQPNYPLVVAGLKVATYRADFAYQERDGHLWRRVVEDVKGVITPTYRLKRKLMQACYGIAIQET